VILDLADPLHPTIISEYTETVSGGVHNVFIVGDLVYATHGGTRDMHIIDVSDLDNPREVGRWGLDNPNRVLHDIFIKDGVAYLSYWDDGLVILDLGGAGKGGTPTDGDGRTTSSPVMRSSRPIGTRSRCSSPLATSTSST
jgi:hypothetical protein